MEKYDLSVHKIIIAFMQYIEYRARIVYIIVNIIVIMYIMLSLEIGIGFIN